MSLPRYAARVDSTRSAIVKAVREAGWNVTQLKWPVDLLCDKKRNGLTVIRLLECKPPANKANKPRLDKRQKAQAEFCERLQVPYVVTAEQALRALGEIE